MFGQKSDFYLFVGIFRAFLISSLIVIVCPNREKPREDWTQSIELVSWFVFPRLIGVEQRVLHLEPGSATEQKGSSAGGGHWGTGRIPGSRGKIISGYSTLVFSIKTLLF